MGTHRKTWRKSDKLVVVIQKLEFTSHGLIKINIKFNIFCKILTKNIIRSNMAQVAMVRPI